MLTLRRTSLAAGTRVKVKTPGPVPHWSVWDPCQRTSSHVKKRLQGLFFKGDRRVTAEIVYIASESDRDKLKAKGRVKLHLRDAAGSSVTILADANNLAAAS
jgi:hypothetical protein